MTPKQPGHPESRWSDLERPPLNAVVLRRALVRPGTLWSSLEVVEVTGSTNTDLVARVKAGPGAAENADEGAVLIAEEQSAGRGRLDRHWTAPARSGLFFSVLLKPDVPVERWGWLPLLAGLATATALSSAAGTGISVKWPNDLVVRVAGEERKAGGILAERVRDGIVLGIGINVSLRAEELPVPGTGSLALAGAESTDRELLLRAVLRSLERWYADWRAVGGDPEAGRLREAYAAGCATLGRTVRAELPGGDHLTGEAVGIDRDGRLMLATRDGVQHAVGAGDIIHLRSTSETRE